MKIPITKIQFEEEDFKNILKPLESGWIVQGKYVEEFQLKWSKFTDAKYSLAVSNCTNALHVSLAALGIGYKDEVIVPSFTWIATANAVESVCAKTVFCDISIESFNIDTDNIEKFITNRTKAIIPVHLFGLAANMDKILEIAKKYNLFVIEDAACGFASKYKDIHVGNFGNTGCFSFHPRKAITTGEGGMITTNDKELYLKIKAMRDHGATISDLQRHLGNKPYLLPEFPYAGFNYRMTDIQASIGSSQMNRVDRIIEKRIYWAKKYDELIDRIDWLIKPFNHSDYEHGYQSYVCLFSPESISLDNIENINNKRNEFMEYLYDNGISTRPGTHAVHILEYYRNKYSIKPEEYPNSYIADRCSITFPLYPSMKEEEFEYIKEKITKYKI